MLHLNYEKYLLKAKQPKFSQMEVSEIGLQILPKWQDSELGSDINKLFAHCEQGERRQQK
ncbi:hypothetical protein KKG31_03030 [Patescibacteria group bacterium]|nr:hypothetical protein [Patescibacteria group bacterium]